MRPLFSETSVAAVRLVVAVTFSVATILIDSRFDALTLVRQVIKTGLWPVEQVAFLPGKVSTEVFGWVQSQGLIVTRLESLALENERLRTEQLKLQTLRAENSELRRLLGVQERVNERLLQAQIERLSNDPFVHRLTINRGLLAGVAAGQPVISADGLVGQVVVAYPHAADVLMMTDATHHLPVQVTRTRERAIAVGVGRMDRVELRNLPDTVDIIPGDLLETSGLGERFQPGIPVARVKEVIRAPGQPFARVIAEPLAPLARLSLVMVDLSEDES
ncbi:MAG: rod shape-determining protein MreC [Litorivicinaceae bacterium]